MLAVLKADGTYIMLDAKSPAARLVKILEDLEPCWLIASPELAQLVSACIKEIDSNITLNICWWEKIPEGFKNSYLLLDQSAGNHISLEASKMIYRNNLCYIIYTSGSTGFPKGVQITHENVIHFIFWSNNHFNLNANDKVSCHSPLHFDGSVWDIYGALSTGAVLNLIPPKFNLIPTLLANHIRESKITHWSSVPSVLNAIANRDVLSINDFKELRRIIWYGEVFPTQALIYWMKRLPHVKFTNAYGPTEATIVSSYFTVEEIPKDPTVSIPIGTPIPGKPLKVFDNEGLPVDVNEIGNLYIGGKGLSPGYWKDKEKTDKSFYEIPPNSGDRWYRTGDLAKYDANGIYFFHGRSDRQIKAGGNRIELDEIELAIEKVSIINVVAVTSIPYEGIEGNRICAAFVSSSLEKADLLKIRKELSQIIPSYMIPRLWVQLSEIPKNQSGKTDYHSLKKMFTNIKRK